MRKPIIVFAIVALRSILFGGTEGVWTGQIVQTIEDSFGAARGASRSLSLLETASGERLVLDQPEKALQPLSSCGAVRIVGVRSGNSIRPSTISPLASNTPPCQSTGVQTVATLLFQYPTTPLRSDFSPQNLADLLFGPNTSLDGFLREASFGKASATGAVFGPFTISQTWDCSVTDLSSYRDQALKVAAGAVDLHAYSKFILIVPWTSECGGVVGPGEAIVNCPTFVLPDGSSSNAGVALAALAPSEDYHEVLPTIIHEIGHLLGIINHASSVDFGATPLGLLGAAGIHDEYGDRFSSMGGGLCQGSTCTHGHFDTEHKLLLGWLDESQNVQIVSSSGIFALTPYENPGGIKALKIQRPGTGQTLWLEYRQPIGYDSTLSLLSANAFSGALIHYDPALGYEGTMYTHLIDFHPVATPNDFANSVLQSGETWTDPYTPLTISVGTPTAAGLPINVSFGGACAAASPGNVLADGGPGSFALQIAAPASCQWTPVSQVPWITLTGTQPQFGNGSVSFTVAANQSPLSRAGFISLGKTLVSITQKATMQLLYSNLGPSDTFGQAGYGIGALNQGAAYSVASPFIATVTAALQQIEVFLGVDSQSTDKPAVNVSVLADANGRPGNAIETIPVTAGFPVSGAASADLAVSSALHPILSAGQQYWLSVSPLNPLSAGNLLMYWALNSTGATAPMVAARAGNNTWGTTGTTLTAFRVSGSGPPNGYLSASVNSASFGGDAVSPGEIIALFGEGLGPDALVVAQPVAEKFAAGPLQGVSVLFDGSPAPLIYVSGAQIGVTVPYGVTSRSATQIQVVQNGVSSTPLVVPVTSSAPGIFSANSSGQGQAAVLNQDGSPNSAANPAHSGTVIVLFATGEGETNPPGTDGLLASTVFPKPILPVSVTIDGLPANLTYSGAAPLEIAGLMQVNVQIPFGVHAGPSVPILLSVGANQSQTGLTVAIQ